MDDLRQVYHSAVEGDGPLMAVCPVHGDNDPSLAIYRNGAKCFGCGRYWNASDFRSQFNSVVIRTVYQSKRGTQANKYLPVSLARTFNRWLLEGPFRSKIDWLQQRGFTEAAIKRYGFGYSPGVYTIPVYSVTGKALHGLRFRRDDSFSLDGPRYYGLAGSNSVAVYLSHNLFLPREEVYFCEGELKSARLDMEGLPSVSFTNGANALRQDHLRYFNRVQRVYVCYDQDAPGKEAGARVANMLGDKARIVTWPIEDGKGVDDYVQNKGLGAFKDAVRRV